MNCGFEYVCISRQRIEGIDSTEPTNDIDDRFRIIDAFRKDISPNGITLFVSLDVIPIDSIEICNIPDGFIGLNNPRFSRHIKNMWQMYLSNAMLFSGDFSFIYENYMSDKLQQRNMFIQADQSIAYNLYEKGIDIRTIT